MVEQHRITISSTMVPNSPSNKLNLAASSSVASNDASLAPTSPTSSAGRSLSPSDAASVPLPSPPASPPTGVASSPSPAWEISRHSDLERKRMEIVRKRANLERRLFDSKTIQTTNTTSASGGSTSTTNAHGSNARSNNDVDKAAASSLRSSGRGTLEFQDGSSVTGSWFLGQLDGRCFFQWPTGETYDGDTVQGMKHGRGVHTWADGKIYKGEFKENYEHGFGTLTLADGVTRYRGQFHQGKRHGVGTQIWRDKTYEGEWNNNAVCGNGKLSWENGTKYEGQFLQGRYHGQGTLVDGLTGRKYVGSWSQGRKDGLGTEYWPDAGQIYTGAFKANKRHGFGRLTMADGSTYHGGWSEGERAGYGIHLTSNGDVLHCGQMFQSMLLSRSLSFSDLGLMTQSGSSEKQLRAHSDDLNFCLQPHQQLSRESNRKKLHQDDSHLGGYVPLHVYGK